MFEYSLGVDLGTTYTAAAVHREGVSEIVTLATRSAAMPTVVVVGPDGELLVGEPAERRSLEAPERTARQFKRRLGDTTPVLLGGTPYSPQALLAAVLADVVRRVSIEQGRPPERVAIAHPANWGPYKRELIRQIAELADIDLAKIETITEPGAAAIHYASQAELEPGSIVAVYDLGGGTFDAAVVRVDVDGPEVLGEPSGIEHLGGIDFDAAMFDHVARTLGSRFDPLRDGDEAGGPLLWRPREECTRAKEALSTDADAVIGVALPDGFIEVRITRGEFEELIRPALVPTAAALRRAVASAGIEPEDLAGVLLVGGSSRIPLVSEIVGHELGRPVLLDAHPKHAVALGAAAHAAGAEVGEVVEIVGGDVDIEAAVAKKRWRTPLTAAVMVLLLVGGLLLGLAVAGQRFDLNTVDAPNSTTTTEATTTSTSSTSTSTSTTSASSTTSTTIDPVTTATTSPQTVSTVTFDDVPEAPPVQVDPALDPIDTGPAPPNISLPSEVRAAVVFNPVDNGSGTSQPSALNIDLAWQAPTSAGGGTVRYRVYRTPMSGGNVNGPSALVYEGPATSVTVTVPDYGAVAGWVLWDIYAVNEAGQGPVARPEADLPNLVGLHQWRAFSRAVAMGLQVGYNPQLGCGSDNIVCSTNPGAGGRLSLGSLWVITYDE